MLKTNLKTRSKAVIQKKKITFTKKNKNSNSISKGKILISKGKEMQIEVPNYASKKNKI